MKTIRSEVLKCTGCNLCKTVTNKVFGEGNESADILFIGEAPGQTEDETGRPFQGQAGKLLTNIIEAMNLKREDVYIANVLKCRPPGNRNPQEDEIRACRSFLDRQIDIVKPSMIITLGTFASQAVLNTQESIGKLRRGSHKNGDIDVICTYHPAYLLRNPAAKKDCWEDMKKALEKLK